MAEILGFFAGMGMLALVGALIVLFLREMGWMTRDGARLLGRSATMACGAGSMYLLLALLYHMAIYGKLEGALELGVLFHGPYLNAMLSALIQPSGVGAISLAFAWLGRALGGALFYQPIFCGLALAWGMTAASLFLLQTRLRTMTHDAIANDAAFLLLCLPGSVFFFLPGFAPLVLLLCAILIYLLGKRIKPRKLSFSLGKHGGIITLFALLSAAVTICAAEGKIG